MFDNLFRSRILDTVSRNSQLNPIDKWNYSGKDCCNKHRLQINDKMHTYELRFRTDQLVALISLIGCFIIFYLIIFPQYFLIKSP